MRRINNNKYGSTDFQKSYERSQPDEIISQTLCKCSFIIEPVVFLLTIAHSIIGIAFSQFIYSRILGRLIENSNQTFPNLTNSTIDISNLNDNQVCISNSTTNSSASDLIRIQAQQDSAHFFFVFSLFGGIPCIFTTNLLGVNCSKLGRKFLLILGLTVMTVRCTIFLLLSIYTTLPDYLFYISSLLDGLSGSTGLFYMVVHCYIADLTTTKNRSYRLTFINYISSISNLFVSYACGYVIKYLGYVYIFASSLLFHFLALFYLIIFVPEPLFEIRNKSIFERLKSCSFKRIKNSFNVLIRKNHPIIVNSNNDDVDRQPLINDTGQNELKECGSVRQRSVINLVIVANLIYCLAGGGIGSIFTLYIMNTPFCWDSVHISYFSVYTTVVHFISSLIATRFIKVNDILICISSALSYVTALVIYAFAKNSSGIYIGNF
jgi:hypothetical protein